MNKEISDGKYMLFCILLLAFIGAVMAIDHYIPDFCPIALIMLSLYSLRQHQVITDLKNKLNKNL